MATWHEILCINKEDRYNPYERITHIGGKNDNGSSWKITQQRAIQAIENDEWYFYVSRGSNRVKVIVALSPYKNKYIKTESDGQEPNNLLSLPECP